MLKYGWGCGVGDVAPWLRENVGHAVGQVLLKLLLLPVEKSVALHECILAKGLSLDLLTY